MQPPSEDVDDELFDIPPPHVSSKDALQAVNILVNFIEQNSSQPEASKKLDMAHGLKEFVRATEDSKKKTK